MTIPDFIHDGTTYAGFTEEEAVARGVPVAVIEAAVLRGRVMALKAICRARIYAKASAETQSNMAFAVAVIASKTAAQRSAVETGILNSAQSALSWIAAMRANVATLAARSDLDPHDDANWPAVPQDALDLVEMF